MIFDSLKRYYKAFRNYYHVLLHIYLDKYPIRAILRKNSNSIILRSFFEAYYVSFYECLGYEYNIANNEAKLFFKNRVLIFKGAVTDGDIMGVFSGEDYSFLSGPCSLAIDVGANIGDSAIYLALSGANKVVALEPYPVAYHNAVENVRINGLTDKIKLLNVAAMDERGMTTIDASIQHSSTKSMDCRSGSIMSDPLSVPTMRIEDILDGESAVFVKIDCEGCEYKILGSLKPEYWSKIDRIQIEYHHGSAPLVDILRENGFLTSVASKYGYGANEIGWIYGSRRDVRIVNK